MAAPSRRVSYPLPGSNVPAGQHGSIVVPEDVNKQKAGEPNKIRTSRFTWLTWIPLSLYWQFHRAANIYFFLISVLVIFPSLSPFQPASSIVPFVAVLFWTALKDMYEDLRRKRDDDAENLRACLRYDLAQSKFVQCRWKDILVGDLLCLLTDEISPVDLMLASASLGQAWISTAALDGETNLKDRRPADSTSKMTKLTGLHEDPTDEDSVVKLAEAVTALCVTQGISAGFDEPKGGTPDMGGQLKLSRATPELQATLAQAGFDGESAACTLNMDNFIPRGCVLRNTAWVVGVAAYVGDETKGRLSMETPKHKVSNLQVSMNYAVIALVTCLLIFCIFAGVMGQVIGTDSGGGDFVVATLKYFIILYQVVPISLYVAFEVVKLALGFQINMDSEMRDAKTQQFALARTADLVEEMGQVMHVFSDKTGTLTRNEMRFARCFVADTDLGEFRPKDRWQKSKSLGHAADGENVSGSVSLSESLTAGDRVDTEAVVETRALLQTEEHPLCEDAKRFFMCLATCHSARVEAPAQSAATGEPAPPKFNGSSPDEVAFLKAAHEVGVSMCLRGVGERGETVLKIDTPDGVKTMTILAEVPFTSDRKRMTVVARTDSGELMCITKGADSVMGPLLSSGSLGESATVQINKFARQGLRTLVVAWKVVDAGMFKDWKVRYDHARQAKTGRDEQLAPLALELETNMSMAGVTATEDRLQEGCPEAIAMLKNMGILTWVLTGDKVETAEEIAKACKLFGGDEMILRIVDIDSDEKAWLKMQDGLENIQRQQGKPCVLVLDGESARHCTATPESRTQLYSLSKNCQACVCCRLSPQQKRGLIQMVRDHDKRCITLAIGDGANDVAMIQGAHVGVGVRGKEGLQAVQASDVAISQFRFLTPLLQCHGRRAYRRVSTFLCYYIYKHVAIAVADMIWAFQSKFDGTIAYPEWLNSAWPLLFSSFPVMAILSFDKDLPDSVSMNHPEIYREGRDKVYFNLGVFIAWMMSAVWHGALAWMAPYLILEISADDKQDEEFWKASLTSFTLIFLFVQIRLWTISLNKLGWILIGLFALTFLAYVVTVYVLGETMLGEWMQPNLIGIPTEMLSDSRSVMAICLAPLSLWLDGIVYAVLWFVFPTPLDWVRGHTHATGRRCFRGASQESPPAMPHFPSQSSQTSQTSNQGSNQGQAPQVN